MDEPPIEAAAACDNQLVAADQEEKVMDDQLGTAAAEEEKLTDSQSVTGDQEKKVTDDQLVNPTLESKVTDDQLVDETPESKAAGDCATSGVEALAEGGVGDIKQEAVTDAGETESVQNVQMVPEDPAKLETNDSKGEVVSREESYELTAADVKPETDAEPETDAKPGIDAEPETDASETKKYEENSNLEATTKVDEAGVAEMITDQDSSKDLDESAVKREEMPLIEKPEEALDVDNEKKDLNKAEAMEVDEPSSDSDQAKVERQPSDVSGVEDAEKTDVTDLAPDEEPEIIELDVPKKEKARQFKESGQEDKENVAVGGDEEELGDEEEDVIEMIDRMTQTRKPPHRSKALTVRPDVMTQGTQTDGPVYPTLVPLGTPMYMPLPMMMYTTPTPAPIPVPLPVPVPIFVPTTRNSYRGIRKQIRRVVSKVPANMLEAELLKLAGEMVGDNRELDQLNSDDSELEEEGEIETIEESANGEEDPPKPPPMDLEKDIRADKVVPKALPAITPDPSISPGPNMVSRVSRMGGPSSLPKNMANRVITRGPKRRVSTQSRDTRIAKQPKQEVISPASAAVLNMVNVQPKERPDAKHHLKFTYGVNAWRHWVVQKNAELEKARSQGRYMKTFDTDILKLRADELIYTLCMFVKEVRKPNGEEYTPDSVFYLTLGIQEYLFENGRIDNVFTDMYYEPFTSALHEIVKDFKLPVNEMGYFVTRIEEEHLWESKQLGAHSPQVLLNTMIYFNTKYFLLKTVEQHKRLSFSHIMKHWKRTIPNPATRENQASIPGLEKKTILLRYYPPPAKGKADERKCYEQHENPESPLRCPVKLYEFYLSKCPESTKSRSDLFYLQPERSCVPDSPVWYSSNPLNNHQLDKMLQRLLMVREVQEHMLAEASENVP